MRGLSGRDRSQVPTQGIRNREECGLLHNLLDCVGTQSPGNGWYLNSIIISSIQAMSRNGCMLLQGEMLASSQAQVVELHNTLTRHAHKSGITDHQLLVDNARMINELDSSI